MSSLLVEQGSASPSSDTALQRNARDAFFARHFPSNPEFFQQGVRILLCLAVLQGSNLALGTMQELLVRTKFNPTTHAPDGYLPSAAFCALSNRFVAVIVAMIAVRIRHGSVFSNNKAPLLSFTPCAFGETMGRYSQYASLKFISFPVQTVFQGSKIIPVMIMGKALKGTVYTWGQCTEALLLALGAVIFWIHAKGPPTFANATELMGLLLLVVYIALDSFASQWQDRLYVTYGRPNIDPYQMMLGVNISKICFTTAGLIISNDFPVVYEFLQKNPNVLLQYNILMGIASTSVQLCTFYMIKEFGPIVFTVIMTTKQMLWIILFAILSQNEIPLKAVCGALLVFGVIFYQIQRKYYERTRKQNSTPK